MNVSVLAGKVPCAMWYVLEQHVLVRRMRDFLCKEHKRLKLALRAGEEPPEFA